MVYNRKAGRGSKGKLFREVKLKEQVVKREGKQQIGQVAAWEWRGGIQMILDMQGVGDERIELVGQGKEGGMEIEQ